MKTMFVGGSMHGKTEEVDPTARDIYIETPTRQRELYYRKLWWTGTTETPFFALHTLTDSEIDQQARPLMPK